MPPFPKPNYSYEYDVSEQIDALRAYRDTQPGRATPAKRADRLTIVSWNIANLGLQDRRNDDFKLIAEILSWFDMAAIQEVGDDVSQLYAIQSHLPPSYKLLFTDVAGNNERLAYLYDSNKISLLEMVGEIAIPPSQHRWIRLSGIRQTFKGFDRNPFVASFQARGFRFALVNVHLYFGSTSSTHINRRRLETYAVARWADLRRKNDNAYTRDIIALGDFNIANAEPGDPLYEALTRRGLHLPSHATGIGGSAVVSDNDYDQIAFFPGQTGNEFTGEMGVFDFDGALFSSLFTDPARTQSDFLAYLKYYVSDHRPMWAQFRI